MTDNIGRMELVEDFVRVGKAISDPTRVRILACLSVRDLCVCELVHLLEQGQPVVSRHLGVLRNAGLVTDLRDGKYVNYRLRRPAPGVLGDTVVRALLEGRRDDRELRKLMAGARTVDRERLCRPAVIERSRRC
jgi:ArsR family transcriptional regulator, arsenate/arsenite/antimonite-responsive transcriptional repressor